MSHNFQPAPGSFAARFCKRCDDLARTGNTVQLENLLENLPFPHGSHGFNPLHVACGEGHTNFVQFLLANGANIEARQSPDGSAALHIACANGKRSVVNCLEAHDPDFTSIRDSDGATCLHIACGKNDTALVRDLLGMGAEPNVQRFDGCYPVQIAARMGNLDVVNLLVTHGSTFKRSLWRRYEELRAADGANMISDDDEDRSTNLSIACEAGDINLVRRLIELGADVNRPSNHGNYPLHIAASDGNKDLVIFLLDHGANINRTSRPDFTALLAAVENRHFDVATLMVERGAQTNIYPRDKMPPHAVVVDSPECSEGMLLLHALVNAGSDSRWRDDDGCTLLHYAASRGSNIYAQYLLNFDGINPGAIGNKGLTALYCAAHNGHRDVVRLLLRAGVDRSVRVEGETSLDVARRLGLSQVVRELTRGDEGRH